MARRRQDGSIVEANVQFLKTIFVFVVSVVITYFLATLFYTQQILSGYQAIGAVITTQDQLTTFVENFAGLTIYGVILTIALLVGFLVAWLLKKILRPLALVAYPVAGGVSVFVTIILIESQLGGGAGIIGGARTTIGMALQALAGLVGGIAFELLRPKNSD